MPSSPPAGKELVALLSRYANDVQDTAYAARDFVFAIIPDALEVVDDGARVIGYGYGKRYRDMICTLILSKSEIKLGIVGGATLPDPRRLMKGAGKVHRHVALTSPKDVARPGLKPLVKAALSAWRRRAEGGA